MCAIFGPRSSMHRVLLTLAGVLACLLVRPAHAGMEILWPVQPPEWGLLLNPGAQRKPEDYRLLAQRIQEEAPVPLAVGISNFLGNWPEPFQMKSMLNSFKQEVASRATSPLSDEKFLVAGHSMAGIILQELLAHERLGGVVLMGAYPSNDVLRLGNGLRKAGIPALILAGEWDGLTRITRVLDTVLECERVTPDHPNYKRCLKQRVVVLPGVNHSDFANGELQAGDLSSELDLGTAHTAIARAVAGYWSDVLLAPGDENTAIRWHQPRWRDLVTETRTWAAAWARIDQMDTRACLEAQTKLLPEADGIHWDVIVRSIESAPGFALAKPTVEEISEGHYRVTAIQSQDRPFNPLDLSLQSRAFTRLSCKLKSEEALRLFVPRLNGSASAGASCRSLNEEIYADVLAHMPAELKDRLSRRGTALTFGEDIMMSSGVKWISSKPTRMLNHDERRAVVSLPRLQTSSNAPLQLDGMHYCQFVPPTQLGEWIFFDAFKILAHSKSAP